MNKLLGHIKHNTLPDFPTDVLFNDFANYFINKIDNIFDKLTINLTKLTTNDVFSNFDLPTIIEIYNLIVTAKNSSSNDPLPLIITKLIASTLALI